MKHSFLPMMAAGVLGGGVTAATLLGSGALGERVTRTVVSPAPLGASSTVTAQRSSGLTTRDVFRRAAPGVVFVRARTLQGEPSPFDVAQRADNLATGSGFVIDAVGRLLTNAHLVAGATDIRVTFSDDRTVPARVLGKDEDTDLALLQVEPEELDLRPLELGSSSSVEVGDPTVAIGNPFGLDRTLTTGVVSAKQGRIVAPSGFSIDNVIQTDATVNPGHSGGPLLDAGGRVVGVNSQIATGGIAGVGFAVPIDTAKAIIPELQAHRTISHAYLGIRGSTGDPLVSLDEGASPGVTVQEVDANGPAARAGILGAGAGAGAVAGGDVIVAVDGQPVRSMADVDDVVSRHRPGDGLAVDILRGRGKLTVQVELTERPASVPMG